MVSNYTHTHTRPWKNGKPEKETREYHRSVTICAISYYNLPYFRACSVLVPVLYWYLLCTGTCSIPVLVLYNSCGISLHNWTSIVHIIAPNSHVEVWAPNSTVWFLNMVKILSSLKLPGFPLASVGIGRDVQSANILQLSIIMIDRYNIAIMKLFYIYLHLPCREFLT